MVARGPSYLSRHKAPLLLSFFFLFGLSACNPSWIADPLSRYLKNKTGIEFKINKISTQLYPLSIQASGIQMSYQKVPVSWKVTIPELRLALGWAFSWEGLPWPEVRIEKISIQRPSMSIRMPPPRQEGDWRVWLKKIPVLKQIEVTDFSGHLKIGETDFQLTQGTRLVASFTPEQGGKIEYRIKRLQGRWNSKDLKFIANSQGSIDLFNLQDQPKWRGYLNVSDGNLLFKEGAIDQISGTFRFLYQDRTLEISGVQTRLSKIDWKRKKAAFSGHGHLALSGTIRQQETPSKIWLLDGLDLKFDELDFQFEHGTRLIKGRAGGQARIQGPLRSPVFTARILTKQTQMDLPPVFTRGLEAEIDLQGKFPSFSFPEIRAKATQTEWQLASGPLSVLKPEARFSALIRTDNRQIFLNDIILKSENWSPLSGSLLFNLNKGPAPQGKARSESFPLLQFLKHFFPRIIEPFPGEIPCQGTLEWNREKDGSPFDFSVSLSPVPISFHLPKTDWAGEDIRTRIQGSGQWFFRDKKFQLDLNQIFYQGTLSRSPWNFVFDHNPLKTRYELTIDNGKQTKSIIGTLGLQYDPLGDIKVTGEWPFNSSPPAYSCFIEVQSLPLEKGFPLLIGDPLSEDHPFWENVDLQGRLQGQISILKKDETYDMQGRMLGSQIDLTMVDPNFSFQRGDLDFPFHFSSSSQTQKERGFSESGFIQVENLKGFHIEMKKQRLSIRSGINHFEIADKIQTPLGGGQVTLNSFRLSNLLKDWRMEGAISLKDVDLSRLFQGQGITGTLHGDLTSIRVSQERARMEGTLKAQIFEGSVEGKDWIIQNPFSQDRVIQGSLFFNHLNLEPITQRFSFGKITGFVQGRVTDLAVRHNLPERFHLEIHTQEVPEVPKRINIKAVENIGLLGSGWGELDALRKGINRFISEYAYREIGLSGTLKEDLFTLRGTIFEDGIEYLVRKSGFFGIDVINRNPDNEILFSDIMERMRSLGKKPREGTKDENK